jgi:uncharacterized membrane-anchored protein
MDRRTLAQLRLQRTVEGLSVVAISYYAIALLGFPIAALTKLRTEVDATLTAGVLAPLVVLIVWLSLARIRRGLEVAETKGERQP